jgi:hypothetical protein
MLFVPIYVSQIIRIYFEGSLSWRQSLYKSEKYIYITLYWTPSENLTQMLRYISFLGSTESNEIRKLWVHSLQSLAYCEIANEKGWTEDTNRCSWTFTRTRKPTWLRIARNYILVNRKGFEFHVTFPEDGIASSFIEKY